MSGMVKELIAFETFDKKIKGRKCCSVGAKTLTVFEDRIKVQRKNRLPD